MKTLLELDADDCRYIAGNDHMFCAQPKHVYLRYDRLVQSPYCREHYILCTTVDARHPRATAA